MVQAADGRAVFVEYDAVLVAKDLAGFNRAGLDVFEKNMGGFRIERVVVDICPKNKVLHCGVPSPICLH